MPDVTIVIASDPGRDEELRRTVAAYERESSGIGIDIRIFPRGEGAESAWTRGAQLATGTYLHFTTDDYEPHPGWWQAAAGAVNARLVPAPVIWSTDGDSLTGADDWRETVRSILPFLSRIQLKQAGLPHINAAWPALPTALRSDYAFTSHATTT